MIAVWARHGFPMCRQCGQEASRSQAQNVTRVNRPLKTLERKLSNRLDLYPGLGLGEDPRRDQDLAIACLAAKARREIGDRTDRSIVETALEPYRAYRRIAACDANTEPQHVAMLLPALDETDHGLAHAQRHAYGLQFVVFD